MNTWVDLGVDGCIKNAEVATVDIASTARARNFMVGSFYVLCCSVERYRGTELIISDKGIFDIFGMVVLALCAKSFIEHRKSSSAHHVV